MAILNQPTCDSNDVMFTFWWREKWGCFFTNENKILVKVLRQDKGYSVKNVKVIFRQATVAFSTGPTAVERSTQRVLQRKSGSGRKHTSRASENIDATPLTSLFQIRKMHPELIEQCVTLSTKQRHYCESHLTFPYWQLLIFDSSF